MAALTETDYVRISTEAGEDFVEAYYNALNLSSARKTIQSFYVPTTGINTERGLPFISYNGEVIQDARELQDEYESNAFTFFDPQSINVHVLNPTMGSVDEKTTKKKAAERSMSMVVQVSGNVRLEERQSGPLKHFSDSFVLVPNTQEAAGVSKGKQDEGRKWLIQSQHFRFVVDPE